MLSSKEVLSAFKAAAWKRPDEIDAFIAEAGAVAPPDLVKLLEVLGGRLPDPQVHRLRLTVFARLVEAAPDKSLFVPFVKALKAADPALRTTVVALLTKVNSATEHEVLVPLLREKEAPLRGLAAKALQQLGGSKTVFELLSRAVGERDFPGRPEALEVLVSFARSQAVPALIAALEAGNLQEKVLALKLLADARVAAKDPAAALKAIAPALELDVEPVLVQAIASFSALCSEEDYWEYVSRFLDFDSPAIARGAVEGLRRFASPRSIGALERKLRAGPRAVRLAVLGTLESIGTDEVLPPLVEGLAHKQLPVQKRAAEVLQHLSVAKKLDLARTIVWLLRSRDVNVRRMAAEVVRSVPDPDDSLWPKLIALLRDQDWWVRERVMDALVDLGGLNLTKHLLQYLADKSEVIRRFAVRVLARLKDPKTLRALLELATKDPDWWVRESAVEAVAAIGDPRSHPYLIQLLATADETMLVVCLQALIDMKAAEALPQVVPLLRAQNPDVRLMAVRFLAAHGTPEQSAALGPLHEDFAPAVRSLARDLLTRWKFEAVGAVTAGTPMLDRFLIQLARLEGDDLIVAAGKPVFLKRLGRTTPMTSVALTEEQVHSLLLPHLTADQSLALQALQDVDYSHEVKSEGLRFRANVFNQLGGLSAVFRRIKGDLPEFEKLGLPPIIKTFGEMKNGLVLVGGPTGSGKSTTLAAIIDYINRTSSRHIVCIEDPIEVLHRRKLSLVNQREVGSHTSSFSAALRSTLRQDPNVILVGELRDLDTIAFTIIAAETGHLVLGTVHTVSAATSVDRMISAFPAGQQEQVRSTLAESLRAVVCQYLLKEKNGPGRQLAVEVMINNEAVANLIRKGKAFQLPSVIATAREQGMQLMDHELMRLYKDGKISAEDAFVKAASKKDFEAIMEEAASQSAKAAARKPLTTGAQRSSSPAQQEPLAQPITGAPAASRPPPGPQTPVPAAPAASRPPPGTQTPFPAAPAPTRPPPAAAPKPPGKTGSA